MAVGHQAVPRLFPRFLLLFFFGTWNADICGYCQVKRNNAESHSERTWGTVNPEGFLIVLSHVVAVTISNDITTVASLHSVFFIQSEVTSRVDYQGSLDRRDQHMTGL